MQQTVFNQKGLTIVVEYVKYILSVETNINVAINQIPTCKDF